MKTILLPVIARSILMILFLQNLFSLIPTVTANPLTSPVGVGVQVESESIELAGFRLISATEGWLRLNQHLYWTEDSGQSWTEITPTNLGQSTIQAVWFVDTQSGWLVLTHLEASGAIAYLLARTSNGGAAWQITFLPLFAPGDPAALAGAIVQRDGNVINVLATRIQSLIPNADPGISANSGQQSVIQKSRRK